MLMTEADEQGEASQLWKKQIPADIPSIITHQ